MAELTDGALTLADWTKRLDPDGQTSAIAELMHQMNGVMNDILWIEGNLPTGHRITQRTSLSTPAWRMLNQGTAPSKTTTAQIDESIGMLDDWSEVDKKLADLNGNTAAFRLSEATGHIEAMVQEFVQTLFYGNTSTAPEEFLGLAPRYNSLSGNISQNVIDGGGTGADNSSIWLVGWGNDRVCGIYPKGSKAGIDHQDMGLQVVETTAGIAGSRMLAYRDHWAWEAGLAVKDWRYAVRIANIDISNLVAKSSAADLIDLMIKAIHRIPNMDRGKFSFYMNRSTFQMLDIQRRDDAATGGLTYPTIDGVLIPHFRGVPIRKVDQLTEAEAQIT